MKTPMMPRRHALVQLLATAALAATTAAVPGPAAASGADSGARHQARAADAVLFWNRIAADAFAPTQGTNALAQSRSFAILQASVHDALNAIQRRYAAYTPGVPAAPHASIDAAVATAAREVLVQLLPEQAAMVEAAYADTLQAVRDGRAKTAGIATGQAAAWVNLNRRLDDGADGATQPVYVPGTGPGEYQFTPPFDFAGLPGWGRVRPFVIDPAAHALPGPHDLASKAYAQDFAHVKAIGHVHSTTRTAEQTEIAGFWYEDSPLGWNRIALAAIQLRRLDAWEAARALALLHFAMADGFIAGFAEKYAHRFWRPVTAIHAAADDGNPLTAPDVAWQPLLPTPPVPDYPSTHTVLGWAAAEVLIALFGDHLRYDTTSLTLPGVVRSFRGFSQAAEENGASRVYAGIHFRHAVHDGRRQGRGIGQAVATALPPVR
ncbi:vanadium-dependent haloperoxidase [Rubrivivax sp. RP6-9]|uniref:vanadium-dependent haloperoxidase n=1 Tax=Rubrivivax sp. RP6-9 TaxID=3415750 RepID=UPI003CC67B4D